MICSLPKRRSGPVWTRVFSRPTVFFFAVLLILLPSSGMEIVAARGVNVVM